MTFFHEIYYSYEAAADNNVNDKEKTSKTHQPLPLEEDNLKE